MITNERARSDYALTLYELASILRVHARRAQMYGASHLANSLFGSALSAEASAAEIDGELTNDF